MDNNQNTDQQFGAALAKVLLGIFSLGAEIAEEFRNLLASAELRLRNLWDGIVPQDVVEATKGKATYLTYAAFFFGLSTSPKDATDEAKDLARLLVSATRGIALGNEGGYAFSDAEVALATKRLYDKGGSLAVIDDLADEGRRWVEGGRKGKCPQRPHVLGGKTIQMTVITSRKRYVATVETILAATKAEASAIAEHSQHQAALAEYEEAKAIALANNAPLPPEPKAPVKKAPVKKSDSEIVRQAHAALYKGLAMDKSCKVEEVDNLIGLLQLLRLHCVDSPEVPSDIPAIIMTDSVMV